MADIVVDTYKLDQYAQRISAVNSRINRLDYRLDSLYLRVGLQDLFDLIQCNALAGYCWRLTQCGTYLQQTAVEFEQLERELLQEDPLSFNNVSGWISRQPVIPIVYRQDIDLENESSAGVASLLWSCVKSEIADFPEDVKDAGEGLAWIEKQYEKWMPEWLKNVIDVCAPSSLKSAYTLTSGILQGDLTLKEGWDEVKKILSKNTKLAIFCETLTYTFEKGSERSDELMERSLEQLREGDILGTLFEGAEGFVDIILGGAIEVLGDVGAGAADSYIDDISGMEYVNKGFELATRALGMNDGEGYSIGGLLDGATEKISEGIDKATDVITDGVNIVTDALTDGTKWCIQEVRSIFA